MVKTTVRRNEERTYVSILVLSQSKLLSHNSQPCKFFPNIYIYSEINSRLLATVSSISLDQYLIDAVYHHTHANTLPKVGLEPPWSTNAMLCL